MVQRRSRMGGAEIVVAMASRVSTNATLPSTAARAGSEAGIVARRRGACVPKGAPVNAWIILPLSRLSTCNGTRGGHQAAVPGASGECIFGALGCELPGVRCWTACLSSAAGTWRRCWRCSSTTTTVPGHTRASISADPVSRPTWCRCRLDGSNAAIDSAASSMSTTEQPDEAGCCRLRSSISGKRQPTFRTDCAGVNHTPLRHRHR